jgi:hypothetical protein
MVVASFIEDTPRGWPISPAVSSIDETSTDRGRRLSARPQDTQAEDAIQEVNRRLLLRRRIPVSNDVLIALVTAHAYFYGALLRMTSPFTLLLGLDLIAVYVGQVAGVWLWRRKYALAAPTVADSK